MSNCPTCGTPALRHPKRACLDVWISKILPSQDIDKWRGWHNLGDDCGTMLKLMPEVMRRGLAFDLSGEMAGAPLYNMQIPSYRCALYDIRRVTMDGTEYGSQKPEQSPPRQLVLAEADTPALAICRAILEVLG